MTRSQYRGVRRNHQSFEIERPVVCAEVLLRNESIRMQHQPFPLKDTLKHQADLQGGCAYRRVWGYTLYFPLEQWHMERT